MTFQFKHLGGHVILSTVFDFLKAYVESTAIMMKFRKETALAKP